MLSCCSDYTSNCNHLLPLCYHYVLILLQIVIIYFRYVIIMFSFCSDYTSNFHSILLSWNKLLGQLSAMPMVRSSPVSSNMGEILYKLACPWENPSETYGSQLGLLFPIYGKIKLVQTCSNHQPNKLGYAEGVDSLRVVAGRADSAMMRCSVPEHWLRNDESRLWLNPLSTIANKNQQI